MAGSPNHTDADRGWESHETTYHIMYRVKRPRYDFIFAIPLDYPLYLDADRAILQVCFKGQCQSNSGVLDLEELQDFYDSLGHLVEYIRVEREKRWRQL
jgi:hypothetical protein